jgi:hypothetical protein
MNLPLPEMVIHNGHIGFISGTHSVRAGAERSKKGTREMGQSSEVEMIPRWLWATVGVVLLVAMGGVGSISTWVILTTVNHQVRLGEHAVRIDRQDRDIGEVSKTIDTMNTKIDAVLDAMRHVNR